jgi:hypothetical protein
LGLAKTRCDGGDLVKVWPTVGKLRRRLVMSGEPRETGCRVKDWT